MLLSAPVIGKLVDSPDPVEQGNQITLRAEGVVDPDGSDIQEVTFYRSDDSTFEPGTDPQVGTVNTPLPATTNYELQTAADWSSGLWYYFARATDADAEVSSPQVTTGSVNAPPVVGSLTGSPEPIAPGDILTLTAAGVGDPDGSVATVEFFHDSNNSGDWDSGDRLLGADGDGLDGWNWQGEVTWTTGDYFARARDNDDAFSPFVRGSVDQQPSIAEVVNNPNPIEQNQPVTFEARGVVDTDGSVDQVLFYRDIEDSGNFNPDKDVLMGEGSNVGGGTWQFTTVATWDPDVTPLYFAVPVDDAGFQGDPVWTLNQNPDIDRVEVDPDPAVLGEQLDLRAQGVFDSDGVIEDVVFSVHDESWRWHTGDEDATPQEGLPTFDVRDVDSSDDWTWDDLVGPQSVDWEITDQAYADFDQDGSLDVAATVNVTSTAGPDFVSVLLNDGNGNFVADSTVTLYGQSGANYDPQALTVADFDEDGSPDIAVASPGNLGATGVIDDVGAVSVLLNDGSGGFADYTDYQADFAGEEIRVHPYNLAAADFTGDGHVDIVAYSSVDYEMPVFFGDGAGSFTLDRVYSYGSSLWVNGSTDLVGSGYHTPRTMQNVQDMLTIDLDLHEDGGSDLAMVSFEGPQFLFNYLRGIDTDNPITDGFSYFDAGNVIGRAFETGIAGGEAEDWQINWEYRTGTEYTLFGDRADDFYHPWITEGDVDMYHIHAVGGQQFTITPQGIRPPGADETPSVYAYIYDSAGNVVFPVGELTDDTGYTFTWNAGSTDDYYLAITGQELITTDDFVNPFTGYWEAGEDLPGGGENVEYYLQIEAQEQGAAPAPPATFTTWTRALPAGTAPTSYGPTPSRPRPIPRAPSTTCGSSAFTGAPTSPRTAGSTAGPPATPRAASSATCCSKTPIPAAPTKPARRSGRRKSSRGRPSPWWPWTSGPAPTPESTTAAP